MSYYNRLDGDLEIVPPLSHAEVVGLKASNPEMFFGDIAFSIATESTERDTPDGVLTVTTASRVLPAQETGRWRNAEEELGSIAATLYARGHVIRGVTNVEGEENSDMWRMCVRGGRVVRQDVILSWPDLPPEDAPVEDPASGPLA
jgi:hypothetical protein